MSKRMFRVLIVDDHLAWRKTLRLFFAAGHNIEVVEAPSNKKNVIASCRRDCPNLVILEITPSGMDAAREMLKNNPDMHIIGVTADMSLLPPQIAVHEGIEAIVPKDLLADYLSPKRSRSNDGHYRLPQK